MKDNSIQRDEIDEIDRSIVYLSSTQNKLTYFRKLEEITRDLLEVVQILSSWDSDRSHQPSRWSF